MKYRIAADYCLINHYHPDLHPIENIKGIFKKQMASRKVNYYKLPDLFLIAVEEFDNISLAYWRKAFSHASLMQKIAIIHMQVDWRLYCWFVRWLLLRLWYFFNSASLKIILLFPVLWLVNLKTNSIELYLTLLKNVIVGYNK